MQVVPLSLSLSLWMFRIVIMRFVESFGACLTSSALPPVLRLCLGLALLGKPAPAAPPALATRMSEVSRGQTRETSQA